ncbi:hypothetical protein ACFQ6V_13120 [Streptomyces roseifaciens]
MTFAEQVEGLTSRCGRRTPALQWITGALGVVLAARAVDRLGLVSGIAVSRMTVLRVVMALPEPSWAVPRVLGADEFATQEGLPVRHHPDRLREPISPWTCCPTVRPRP